MNPGGFPPGQTPITNQPNANFGKQPIDSSKNWMQPPIGKVCPPGLEYLTILNELFVNKKIETFATNRGFETRPKYYIKNGTGQMIYTATEDSGCCERMCFGNLRSFNMQIKDYLGKEVIRLYRPLACCTLCCPGCQQIKVMLPPENIVGWIKEKCHCCAPEFAIKNAEGKTETIYIKGPFCACGRVEFEILGREQAIKVGKIMKRWPDLGTALFTDADHFGISFPMALDVNLKAVMLGACFLIDFIYFEG